MELLKSVLFFIVPFLIIGAHYSYHAKKIGHKGLLWFIVGAVIYGVISVAEYFLVDNSNAIGSLIIAAVPAFGLKYFLRNKVVDD